MLVILITLSHVSFHLDSRQFVSCLTCHAVTQECDSLSNVSHLQGMSTKDYMYEKNYEDENGVEYANSQLVSTGGQQAQQIAALVQVGVVTCHIIQRWRYVILFTMSSPACRV